MLDDKDQEASSSLKRPSMDVVDNDESEGNQAKRPNNLDSVKESDDISNIESSIRFLISNSVAGLVIGKGGSNITDFQNQSAARIQLSRAKEFFPGTSDRVISLTGSVGSILTALHLILSKISEEGTGPDPSSSSATEKNQLKLVVPNSVCGAIIGKGGTTIRSFVDESGSSIKISPQDLNTGSSERTVTITGTIEQQLRAVALIITKLSEDPNYASYANSPLAYSGPPFQPPQTFDPHHPYNLQTISPAIIAPIRGPPNVGGAPTSVTVAVPDDHVGSIVGKGGKIINEIQSASKAHIRLSDRGDFVEGTNNRKVTISGSVEAVVAAQHIISQKVQQSMLNDDRDNNGMDRRHPRSKENEYEGQPEFPHLAYHN